MDLSNLMKDSYDVICLVSNDITYDRRMIRICTTLAESGKKVLLVGRKLQTSHSLDDYLFDTYRVSCMYNSGPLFYAALVVQFRELLKVLNYKQLVLVDLDTILVTRLIRKKEAKLFCDLHEYFEETPELIGRPIKKWIWSRVGKWCMTCIDVVYTVNGSLSDIFAKEYNRKIEVIRNVPEQKNIDQTTVITPLKTVYLGVLNPGRGLENIIMAIKAIDAVELTIIGDGPLKEKLELLAKDNKRISFTGALPPEQLSDILSQHHIGWNILEDNSKSYYYSLANKFFDYLNHNLPVVTMDFPEYATVIDKYKCGLKLENSDVTTIENALTSILSNLSIVSEMQSRCSSVIDDNNWRLESKKLLSLYQETEE